jgi:hypothetical protein
MGMTYANVEIINPARNMLTPVHPEGPVMMLK